MATAAAVFGTLIDFDDDGELTKDTDQYGKPTMGYENITESSESDVEEPDEQLRLQQTRDQAQQDAFNNFLRSAKPDSLQPTASDDGSSDYVHRTKKKSDIDRVRNYQQELFERALEENVIAVYVGRDLLTKTTNRAQS